MIKTIFLKNYNIVDVNNENNKLIDEEILHKLILYKNKINEKKYIKHWDKTKKYSNKYELIYIPNKNRREQSISSYKPLSRSYFKLWEIMFDFELMKTNKECVILCLAEGPGGFMESIVNMRNNKNDKIFGITLKSINKDIPGWSKSNKFIKKHNIKITYGIDGTGNLYNIDNI